MAVEWFVLRSSFTRVSVRDDDVGVVGGDDDADGRLQRSPTIGTFSAVVAPAVKKRQSSSGMMISAAVNSLRPSLPPALAVDDVQEASSAAASAAKIVNYGSSSCCCKARVTPINCC